MNIRNERVLILVCCSVGLLLLALGCVQKPAERTATPQPSGFGELQTGTESGGNETVPLPKEEIFIHQVQWPGESLSIIAKWYLGKLMDWEILARHNPELNPNQIFVGDKIRIPLSRMRTFEDMPRSFVEQFVSTEPAPEEKDEPGEDVSQEAQDVEPVEEKDQESEVPPDELELFGPKGLEEN